MSDPIAIIEWAKQLESHATACEADRADIARKVPQ